MTDIVERLRALVILDEVHSDNGLGKEATDEIERLRVALRTSLEALDRADRGQQSTIVSIHNYYLPNGRQRRM